MITHLEDAVAAVVTAVLEEDATVAAVEYVVRSSTTRAEVPGNASVIAVMVQDLERPFGSNLVNATVQIYVATPDNNENTPLSDHRLLNMAIERVFTPGTVVGVGGDEETVSEALAAEIESRITDHTGGGFANLGWNSGRDDPYFQPSLRVLIGLVRD